MLTHLGDRVPCKPPAEHMEGVTGLQHAPDGAEVTHYEEVDDICGLCAEKSVGGIYHVGEMGKWLNCFIFKKIT